MLKRVIRVYQLAAFESATVICKVEAHALRVVDALVPALDEAVDPVDLRDGR